MRDQHRTPGKDERQQGLFLERAPGANIDADGLDEIVPEFMHRGFYRSQEGEFEAVEAVEPSGMLRAVRSESGGFRATSLRGPVRPSGSEDPTPVGEPLQPIRSSVEANPEPEPAGKAAEEEARPPSPWPRPVETGGINLPLLLCLFFVVGLFMWREGTRPVISSESSAPLPRKYPLGNRERMAAPQETVGEANPQPVTTPSLPIAESQEGDGSVAKVAPDEQQSADEPDALFPPDEQTPAVAGSTEETVQPQPDAGTAAQRAAILERMSAGTVDRNDRERRMEGDLQDSSLFPATKPQPRPPAPKPVAAQSAAKRPAQPAEGTGDLFPGDESSSAPAERQAAQPAATTTAPAAGGKPRYQIAEPQL